MRKAEIIYTILSKYGLPWTFCRCLYSLKLKLLNRVPSAENWFEPRNASVKRLDIFNLDTEVLEKFLRRLGDKEKKRLIESADLAVDGKIKAFSSRILDYGRPIRWNYDPITEKVVPLNEKWFRIADFDETRGDIKVIWEASRFSHFYLLSRAYLLTGERKYYEAFHEQLDEWLEKNRYSYGPNYKCGQECALRLVNTLLNYEVFRRKGIATIEDENNVKIIVRDSYKKIQSNFFYAYRCIKNNHTISELLGMTIGAWCCEDRDQLEFAYQKMEEVIKEQFFEDGGYRQFSFNYQRLALQDMECFISISKKIGRELSDISKDKLLKSAQILYQLQNSSGDIPNYGSNDGALIFPVTACEYRDFRPTVQSIYSLITGKRVYEPGMYDEEALWFMGKELQNTIFEAPTRKTGFYNQAGLFHLKKSKANLLIILNDFKTRPAHFDQLHMDLWIKDKNVFCDSGTYSYVNETGRKLVKTAAHNTLKIDGIEQMGQKGPFFIYGWTKRRKVRFLDNLFEGTMESVFGYSHTRKIEIEEIGEQVVFKVIDSIKKTKNMEFYFIRLTK